MEKYKIESFKNIQLFSSLTDEELYHLTSKMVVKYFKKNEIILHEDDTNNFMYIILFGKVKVFQSTQDGKETILAMHQSGDFFGEMSLIDGKTSPAAVMATQDSTVAIISKKNFYSLIFTQNKALENLLKIFCSRLRESWEKIQMLNYKNASERIKRLFTMLSNEYGKKSDEGILLNIKLTHQDIANMSGLTRETVTRIMSKWHKDGEIKVLENKFILLSPDFLQKDLNDVI